MKYSESVEPKIEQRTRSLNSWVVRLAYLIQTHRQINYMSSALFAPETGDVDLDLDSISVSYAKNVQVKIYDWFTSLPEGDLVAHGVQQTKEDFERLYNLDVQKYIFMTDQQLEHFHW